MHKDLGTRHFVGQLAGRGHVVMNAGYTLAPQAQLLGQVADVKRAIGWLKEHGGRYGVGPERIALMGVSSGAHLALLAAYTPNHPKLQPADVTADTSVRAVVSYSGSPDLLSTYEYYRSSFGRYLVNDTLWERWFMAGVDWLFHRLGVLPPQGGNLAPSRLVSSFVGGTPEEVPELYRLGSPIEHVGPHCPPTLLMQGAHDYSGILPDVRRLHQALRRAGVTSVYVEYPETDHAFELVTLGAADWSPAARVAAYDTERFLALMA
jgi:acetyl esterase/lipase